MGKCLVAASDYKADEIIIKKVPDYVSYDSEDEITKYCAMCWKRTSDAIPCDACNGAVCYCSSRCKSLHKHSKDHCRALRIFHDDHVIFRKNKDFYPDVRQLIDILGSDHASLYSFSLSETDNRVYNYATYVCSLYNNNYTHDYVQKIANIINTHTFAKQVLDIKIGFIEHSCTSNCDVIAEKDMIICKAKKDISKGERLSITYCKFDDIYHHDVVKKYIKYFFGFSCCNEIYENDDSKSKVLTAFDPLTGRQMDFTMS